MTLLSRIKLLCKQKGISQRKMEQEIGISNGSSSKWETSSPSIEILQKLSSYFHVSINFSGHFSLVWYNINGFL